MARAGAASACARTDSIKGLARSVANPAYRRLLTAEPTLRRAVPILIIAFLVTIGIGAVVQVLEHRRQALAETVTDIENMAAIVLERIDREQGDVASAEGAQSALDRALPPHARAPGRLAFLTAADGTVVAVRPPEHPVRGRHLRDVLGRGQPFATFGLRTGVAEVTLADGAAAFATVRALNRPLGEFAIIQTRSGALATWRADTALTVTLFATTGFVLLILGFAFHWQATRAREADGSRFSACSRRRSF